MIQVDIRTYIPSVRLVTFSVVMLNSVTCWPVTYLHAWMSFGILVFGWVQRALKEQAGHSLYRFIEYLLLTMQQCMQLTKLIVQLKYKYVSFSSYRNAMFLNIVYYLATTCVHIVHCFQ